MTHSVPQAAVFLALELVIGLPGTSDPFVPAITFPRTGTAQMVTHPISLVTALKNAPKFMGLADASNLL